MIIGVVGDVRYTGLDADAGNEFYLPEGLYPQSAITLLVRTNRDPLALYPDMHGRIAEIDKDAFVFDVKPMTRLIAESLAPRRFSTILLSAFAVVALILSLAGIYAVIAHSVAQRTVEIGIRIAMGAEAKDVLRMVVGQGAAMGVAGVVIGLAGAIGLTRFIKGLLFGIDSLDPATFAGVAALLLAVTLLACYVPARRATKVDPMVALRYE